MAPSIEEAFRPCAENLHALGMEAFGDEACYEADLASLRAYGHAVLARCAREAWGSGFHDALHEIEEEIDSLRKEASKLDSGGASMSGGKND